MGQFHDDGGAVDAVVLRPREQLRGQHHQQRAQHADCVRDPVSHGGIIQVKV